MIDTGISIKTHTNECIRDATLLSGQPIHVQSKSVGGRDEMYSIFKKSCVY
jgi:hypothetical protein